MSALANAKINAADTRPPGLWPAMVRGPASRAAIGFVGLLILVAVFAPLIANDKPFVVRVDGQWRSPLLVSLGPFDCCLLFVFAASVVQFLRLCSRPVASWWAFAVVPLGCVVILAVVPRTFDPTDYRALVRSGLADRALFAPIPHGYADTNLQARRQPPSRRHYLGTDDVGGDVSSRLIHGARTSLVVGFVAVGIATVIGVCLGALLGYIGGVVDFIGMRVVEIVMAVPAFFLVVCMVAFFGRGGFNITVIIGITSWTGTARLVRSEFLKLRSQDFVLAARSLGLPRRRIIFSHILPNALAPAIVNATFGLSSAIFIEAALSFLGFGVAPPAPSWGQMLSEGIGSTGTMRWWLTLFPGMAIFLTVLAYNLVGESLRDALDPKGEPRR